MEITSRFFIWISDYIKVSSNAPWTVNAQSQRVNTIPELFPLSGSAFCINYRDVEVFINVADIKFQGNLLVSINDIISMIYERAKKPNFPIVVSQAFFKA